MWRTSSIKLYANIEVAHAIRVVRNLIPRRVEFALRTNRPEIHSAWLLSKVRVELPVIFRTRGPPTKWDQRCVQTAYDISNSLLLFLRLCEQRRELFRWWSAGRVPAQNHFASTTKRVNRHSKRWLEPLTNIICEESEREARGSFNFFFLFCRLNQFRCGSNLCVRFFCFFKIALGWIQWSRNL